MKIEEKIQLLRKAYSDPEGMKKLGAAMVDVIKLRLPVEGLIRQILCEDPLTAGQIAYYDADVEVPAITMTLHGTSPETHIGPERVFANPFRIEAFALVDKSDLRLARYNALDRAKEVSTDSVKIQEDSRLFTALDAAIAAYAAFPGHTISPDHTLEGASVTQALLGNLIAIPATHGLQAKHIIMNPIEYNDILAWGTNLLGFKAIDTIVETGQLPYYAGCILHVAPHCPIGKVYITPEAQYVGYFPTYLELEPDPFEDVRNHQVGWLLWELVSLSIMNPRGLARLDITRV
jgi:hypothetical protein